MPRPRRRAMLLCICVLAVVTIGLGLIQSVLLDRRAEKPWSHTGEHLASALNLPTQAAVLKPLRKLPGRNDQDRWLEEPVSQSKQHRAAQHLFQNGELAWSSYKCLTSGSFSPEDMQRLIRSPRQADRLSPRDREILTLLRKGSVRKVDQLDLRGKRARLVLSLDTSRPVQAGRDYCGEGGCALVREAGGLGEVLSFHLDRVLGLGLAPPAAARALSTWLLPFRYTDGPPRALSWWDPRAGRDCERGPPCEGGQSKGRREAQHLLSYLLQGAGGKNATSDGREELDPQLIEEVGRLPERARTALSSQCVSERWATSLHSDQTLWETLSGPPLRELMRHVQTRANDLVRAARDGGMPFVPQNVKH
ncbi:Golgi-associated kinase 1A-like [Lepisosteus oculatus]|uniref:Golgi-associated kinase 1A-like n=1 Tax=Lepisosteus oculatus TaxID=7918 RepID=UPI0035F502F7